MTVVALKLTRVPTDNRLPGMLWASAGPYSLLLWQVNNEIERRQADRGQIEWPRNIIHKCLIEEHQDRILLD